MRTAPIRRIAASAAMTLLATVAGAQVTTTWMQSPGGVHLARDAADNVFTAEWDANLGGDIVLTKRGPDGALQWQSRFDNTDPTRTEAARWIATDSQGNAYVGGTILSGFSNPVPVNALLMKFAPDGRLLWRRVLGAPFDGSSVRRVLVDTQDHVLVVGLGTGSLGQVATVRKLAPDGTEVWAWFDPFGIGAPVEAKRAPDGHLLLAGRGVFGIFNGFARIDPQGVAVWTLPAISSPTVGDIAGDAAGNAYIVGGTAAGGSTLSKYSPSGTLLWQREHPMAALRVEVAAGGTVVLSGFPNAGTAGAALAAYTADGQALWSNLDADGPGQVTLSHAPLALDGAGNAYLAGSNLSQMVVTKVQADGRTAWTTVLGSGGAVAVVPGSAGQTYVAGNIQVARLDSAAPPPPPTIDLAVTLADAPDPVRSGRPLTYTSTLRNLGNASAPGAVWRLTLPARTAWQSTTTTQGSCALASGVASCTLGAVAAGATVTVTTVVIPRQRGTITATATATTTGSDANAANDRASATTTVGR